MPDLWPVVKRVDSAVSFFQNQVQRRAALKWNYEKCQTRGSERMSANRHLSGLGTGKSTSPK